MFQKHSIDQIISSSATYLIFLVFILIFQIKSSQAYVDGAPARICEKMLPSHGEQSMKNNVPFNIDIDRPFIRGGGKVTITVTSKNPSKHALRGLLFIMKQPNNKLQAFGTFNPSGSEKDLKTVACFGKEGSGITHTHPRPKTILTFQWTAPNDTSAEYELHATLVRDFNTFWADITHPDKIRVSVNAPASAGLASSFTSLLMAAVVLLIFPHVP